jgi:transketolase
MAWLRLLPNLTVVVPSDRWETREAVAAAAAADGPFFLRISRFPVPELQRPPGAKFIIGKAETLRRGSDAVVIANGVMVTRALAAAEALSREGLDVRVVNMSSIAPLDVEAIEAASLTGAIVTVEEHSVRGGLGGAVAEVLATSRPCHMCILGFPGFLPTGSVEFLFERFRLTAEGIAAATREVIARRDA